MVRQLGEEGVESVLGIPASDCAPLFWSAAAIWEARLDNGYALRWHSFQKTHRLPSSVVPSGSSVAPSQGR